MKKVLFVCGSKQVGGAEKQLLMLTKELSKSFTVSIFLFGKKGAMESQFRNSGLDLAIHSGNRLSVILSLAKKIKLFRPDVQVNWLYEADVLGGILGKSLRVPLIIGSARNTNWPGCTKFKKIVLKFIGTYIASHVVANSQRALDWHKSIGYPAHKISIIPNLLSNELWVPKSTPNFESQKVIRVGIASRPVPGKGHEILLKAVSFLPVELQSQIECSFIGFGLTESELATKIRVYPHRIEILDGVYDLSGWFESIDIYCAVSDSWESDSNSINEAILHHRLVIASDLFELNTYSPPLNIIESGNSKQLANELMHLVRQSQEEYLETLWNRRINLIGLRRREIILSQWVELFRSRI